MTEVESPPLLAPETLDFIFEHVRDAPDKQVSAQENLDSKIVQVFAAAGVVLGLAGLSDISGRGGTPGALLVVAVIAFVVVAAVTFYSIWARRFRVTSHVQELWQHHWTKSPDALRHMIVADAVRAYAANGVLIRRKSHALSVALAAVAVEVVCVGILLIWLSLASRPAQGNPVPTPPLAAGAAAEEVAVAPVPRSAARIRLHSPRESNRHGQ